MFRSNPHLSLIAELQKCGPLTRSESLRQIGTGFYTLDSTTDWDRSLYSQLCGGSGQNWELPVDYVVADQVGVVDYSSYYCLNVTRATPGILKLREK